MRGVRHCGCNDARRDGGPQAPRPTTTGGGTYGDGRLDTSPVGDVTHRMGVRRRPLIGRRGGCATRHPVGL
jgi:hypothetical protein